MDELLESEKFSKAVFAGNPPANGATELADTFFSSIFLSKIIKERELCSFF